MALQISGKTVQFSPIGKIKTLINIAHGVVNNAKCKLRRELYNRISLIIS